MFSQRTSAPFVTDKESQRRQIGSDFVSIKKARIGAGSEDANNRRCSVVRSIRSGGHVFFYDDIGGRKSFSEFIVYFLGIIGSSATGSIKKQFFDLAF